MRTPWVQWLTAMFGFRLPRVARLAAKITPAEFAETLLTRPTDLLALRDEDDSPFFSQSSA
jgi:hypothetical protein